MKNRQGIVWAPILIIVATVVVAGIAVYFLIQGNKSDNENENVTVVSQANRNGSVNTNQATNTNTSVNTNTTTDPTAGWKTYTNTTAGITFRYPNEWPDLNENAADELRDGKIYTSMSTRLIDLSLLNHSPLNYDNLSIDTQFSHISCENWTTAIECEDRRSESGLPYVWIVSNDLGGAGYGALVPTGKYMLGFGFNDAENYFKREVEYQALLQTLATTGN